MKMCVFGNPLYDFGASATVGYQISSTVGAAFSQDAPVLSDGDVIDLLVVDTDVYALVLARWRNSYDFHTYTAGRPGPQSAQFARPGH